MDLSAAKKYFFENWDRDLVVVMVAIIGSYLIGHGGHLMVVLPDDPDEDAQLVIGTDGKLYEKQNVIDFARIMMVVSGTLLLSLVVLMLVMRYVRSRPLAPSTPLIANQPPVVV